MDQVGVLARQRQREPRRVLARLDRLEAPPGLVGERRAAENAADHLVVQPQPPSEGYGLADDRDHADERGVGDELRGCSRSGRTDVEHGAEVREHRRDAFDDLGGAARKDRQLAGFDFGEAAEDRRVDEVRPVRQHRSEALDRGWPDRRHLDDRQSGVCAGRDSIVTLGDRKQRLGARQHRDQDLGTLGRLARGSGSCCTPLDEGCHALR